MRNVMSTPRGPAESREQVARAPGLRRRRRGGAVMGSWSSTPSGAPTAREMSNALRAARRNRAPDGAGLGLACGCLIVAAIAFLLVCGIILGEALS